MTEHVKEKRRTLFDFGALARQYDRWYATPAGRLHDHVQKSDVRRLLRPARPGERLLDVGCGTGHWSAFFSEMGYQVEGVDIAPEMVEAARRAVPACSFRVADACDLPFEDGSFDVVASMAALEFVPDPAAAVREMARRATSGGHLLVGTLNRLAPLNRHRLAKGKQPYAAARLLAPGELRELLEPYGRVRMLASSPRQSESRTAAGKGVLRRLRGWGGRGIPGLRRRLRGPFLVAEVQL
jgi:ubiquinone/menaquinone biosynthesis C-methylase UbiE